MQTEEKVLTGYPSIDKPWLKFYGEEEKNGILKKVRYLSIYLRETRII